MLIPNGTKPPYIEVEDGVATTCYDDLEVYVNSEPIDTLSKDIKIYDSRGKTIKFSVKDRKSAIETSAFNYDTGEPFISLGDSSLDNLKVFVLNGINKYGKNTEHVNLSTKLDLIDLIFIFKKIMSNPKKGKYIKTLQSEKVIKQFTYASIISSFISLYIFWWLAMVGIFFGVRSLLLTWHKGNRNDKNLILYRVISIAGIFIGVLSWYLYSVTKK